MAGDASAGLALHLTDQPSPNEVRFVENALSVFNVARARPYDTRPLHVFLRGEDGETIGGVTGLTRWEWLYIDCFWLPDNLRGGGWGARANSGRGRSAPPRLSSRSSLLLQFPGAGLLPQARLYDLRDA